MNTLSKTALRSHFLSTYGKIRFASTSSSQRVAVVVDGARLPFAQASTIYKDEMAVDLQRMAIVGLMNKSALEKDCVDHVICGNVIQEVRTSNIAREAAINAGLPNSIGSHTVAMAVRL